jgi:hypothetical protein
MFVSQDRYGKKYGPGYLTEQHAINHCVMANLPSRVRPADLTSDEIDLLWRNLQKSGWSVIWDGTRK